MRSEQYSVVRSQQSVLPQFTSFDSYQVSLHYKVYYNAVDDPVLSRIKQLMDWDLWPSLQNSWDFIPYTFVMDWAVGIGKFLEDIDREIYEQYISIRSVLFSEKHSWTLSLKTSRYASRTASLVSYSRLHSGYLHTAPLRVERGHSSAINIVDGASLLLQRTT